MSVQVLVIGQNPRRTFIRGSLIVLTSVVLFTYVLLPIRASGASMQPTYSPGDFRFVNRLAYTWAAPKRGDVVAIRLAGSSVVYVKRIVGLPGERLAIVDGRLHIDRREIREPYVRHRAPWNIHELMLGDEEYFVIGDNRGMAVEDHDLGKTSGDRLIGKVLF